MCQPLCRVVVVSSMQSPDVRSPSVQSRAYASDGGDELKRASTIRPVPQGPDRLGKCGLKVGQRDPDVYPDDGVVLGVGGESHDPDDRRGASLRGIRQQLDEVAAI